jgi:biopolymer transport protein ExbD
MPPKTLFRLGLSLLFLALTVYFSTGHWLNSRIFEPLDFPVALDSRHLQSPPFRINLNETYYASLDLDYRAEDWYQDNRCNYKTILYPKWSLYKLGSSPSQPRELRVSSGEDAMQHYHEDAMQHYYFDGFRASSGRYQVEWDIPVTASCLNPRHPRLRVFTDSWGYRQAIGLAQLFCIFLGGTGLALVALATARTARLSFPPASAPRMFPDMVLRNFMSLTKHAPLPPIHALPHWGIFCPAVLLILVSFFMIFAGQDLSYGLPIELKTQYSLLRQKSSPQETLGVYLAVGEKYYLNGQLVSREGLGTKLKEELNRRADWTVYFEADHDTLYMNAIYAMDTIQGMGGKLVWITPKLREELQQKDQIYRPTPVK